MKRNPYTPPLHDMRRAWAERNPGYRLPQRSARRARIESEVRPEVREIVRARGRCEYADVIPEVACGWLPGRRQLEVDELHGGARRNEEMQDPDQCVLTCPVHHDVKTDGRWFGDVWIGKRVVVARYLERTRGEDATP